MPRAEGVILYDGVCALCNRTVRTLLAMDKGARLRYAPLQGATAAGVRARHPQEPWADSIVFVENFEGPGERLFWRSEAVFRALALAGGYGKMSGLLRVFPRWVRDKVYDRIARSRYSWFGKYASVQTPPEGKEEQFLP